MKNGKKKLPSFMALVLAFVMVVALASPISAYAQPTDDDVILNDEKGIPDKALYDHLVKYYGNDGVLTASDLNRIDSLYLWNFEIGSLKGLEKCENLSDLSLSGTNVSDISALSGLTKLTSLDLRDNNISDISGLSNLTNLRYLDVSYNKIADFSPIDSLNATVNGRDNQRLGEVILNDETGIPDKVLYDYLVQYCGYGGVLMTSDLNRIDSLFLWNREIGSLKGLEKCTNLNSLSLWRCNIGDISGLSGLTKLTSLDLRDNNISDISVLSGLTNLSGLYLSHNNISNISALSGLTNLTSLNLENNNISDISGLSGLTNLIFLDLYNNKIADFSPIDSLNATVIGRDYQSPVVDNSQGSTGGTTGGTTDGILGGTTGGNTGGTTDGILGGITGGNTSGSTGGTTGGSTTGTVGGSTNDVVNEVKDTLSTIETGTEAKEYLADLDKTTLVSGLQSDKELETQVAKAEEKYVEEKNIEVKTPAVSDEVKNLINKDSIKVVGAGLNADANSTVEFSVSAPATTVNVGDTYHNAVALDLKLFVNGTSKSDLDVPVSITMDAPAGVSTSNLVILHYHDGSATPEVITPVVNEDGTITFAVSGFSTFVFANTVDSSYYYYISSPYGDASVKSPKTGESANVAVIMLAISAAAVVVVRRKATVK